MRQLSLEVRAIAFAFLWLCVLESCWATRKEDLERAAELAVERAAERAAERAVEKALESGNSTTESETIRESYSSVRKYDKTLKLPETGYTPDQRREYDRIMREREAAEKASAVLKRSSLLKRSIDKGNPDTRELVTFRGDQTVQHQHQRQLYENRPKAAAPPATPWPFQAAEPYSFPAGGHGSYDANSALDGSQQDYSQRLLPVSGHSVIDHEQFPSGSPIQVFTIQIQKPYHQQLYHVTPTTPSEAVSTFSATYPHYIDRPGAKVIVNNGDYSFIGGHRRGPGQGWIYR